MKIGPLDTDERVLVVAEIGNNHEGDMGVARELVERAADAGAGAVKFQTFRTEHYVSRDDAERFRRLESFRLDYSDFEELAAVARARGLLFISTPFDLRSADFLAGLADALKVSSGDNTFFPLLRRIASARKPTLVSAGLSDLAETRTTVEFLRRAWAPSEPGLGVLHCVSAYPVPADEANLRAIPALSEALACTVGYSDHTVGNEAAPLAVALGARVVEKHFTLDKHFSDFRDHLLSADPGEFRALVERIREAETLLGRGGKPVQPSEEAGRLAMRRSIVAARDLPLSHLIEEEDLTWIRPGGGLAPGEEHLLVGRRLRRPVEFGERLLRTDVV